MNIPKIALPLVAAVGLVGCGNNIPSGYDSIKAMEKMGVSDSSLNAIRQSVTCIVVCSDEFWSQKADSVAEVRKNEGIAKQIKGALKIDSIIESTKKATIDSLRLDSAVAATRKALLDSIKAVH